jgi:transcriptional regulator GlxA family with amidase domain
MADIPVRRVACVVFDGFTVLDMYGPVQAFGACRQLQADGTPKRFFQCFTIGEKIGPVRAGEGPSTHADHAFDDAPAWDILLVPGGFGTRAYVGNEGFLAQLARGSERAAITTTRCTRSRRTSSRRASSGGR